jgi:hypothetical protein
LGDEHATIFLLVLCAYVLAAKRARAHKGGGYDKESAAKNSPGRI